MSFNKKASLEISIQAIVIVVLAMTLLGLGLGFIKGMFSGITDISRTTFERISDQLQRDLINSNEKLIFSQSKVTIEKGKSVLLGWGIKNEATTPLNYWAEFIPIRCPTLDGICPSNLLPNGAKNVNEKWFTFKYNPSGTIVDRLYTAGAAEQQVVRVDLTVPKDVTDVGLYLFDLSIYDVGNANKKYASTDIFVTVT